MRAKEIRALRRRNGWTQAGLASRLGTDAVTVSRWERGASTPRPSAQIRLRELSGPPTAVADLVRLTGDAAAELALKRSLLLSRPARRQRFAAQPAARLRQIERALREQLAVRGRR